MQSKIEILFLSLLCPTLIFGQQLNLQDDTSLDLITPNLRHNQKLMAEKFRKLEEEEEEERNTAPCPDVSDQEVENGGLQTYLPQSLMDDVRYAFYVATTLVMDDRLFDNLGTYKEEYERFFAWRDFNDIHVLLKKFDKCYATFSPSSANLLDKLQDAIAVPYEIENSDCWARGGYKNAYFTAYYEDFKTKLNGCANSCPGGCPVILSGYAQAGGVATIAGIDLREYDPLVLTFGAPKVLYKESPWFAKNKEVCTDIKPERNFRFTTMDINRNTYDRLAYDYNYGASHIGYNIIIDSNGNAVNVGTDSSDDRKPTANLLQALDGKAESDIWGKFLNACTPLHVTPFENDHFCSQNDECMSGFCFQNECMDQPALLRNTGQRCNHDHECISGICEKWLGFFYKLCHRNEDSVTQIGIPNFPNFP